MGQIHLIKIDAPLGIVVNGSEKENSEYPKYEIIQGNYVPSSILEKHQGSEITLYQPIKGYRPVTHVAVDITNTGVR